MNDILPPEILSKIFGLIDKYSRTNALFVCKFWYNQIRSNVNFSSEIIIKVPKAIRSVKKCDIENLLSKWPVLKSVEIHMEYQNWIQDIDYLSNSLLESVTIYSDFSKNFKEAKHPYPFCAVHAVTFNPKFEKDIWKISNISYLKYFGDDEEENLCKNIDNAVNLRTLQISTPMCLFSFEIYQQKLAFI